MKSKWVEADAAECVARGADGRITPDLSLRIYSTRLLGADPKLVLHGGGNTSLKTREPDVFGADVEVLRIKASGFDMATIGPAGLPAVRLAPLRALRALQTMTDDELVAIERANLIDAKAPTPSVEVMLHAFLPHTFIDHTHASAVLSIIDQADGEQKCADAFGDRMAFVPYLMPGFGLAKKAIEVFEQTRPSTGLILGKHGIVTFGDSARDAYERMIEMVSLAEDFVARRSKSRIVVTQSREAEPLEAVAPIVRGACSRKHPTIEGAWQRLVLDFRGGETIVSALQSDLPALTCGGVVTPDHVIRTKSRPLVLAASGRGRARRFCASHAHSRCHVCGRLPRLFRTSQRTRWRHQAGARSPAPRSPRAGRGPVWSRPEQTRRRHRGGHCRRMDRCRR